MSSEIAIKVDNLFKCYHIYDQPLDRLKQMTLPRLQRLLGVASKQYFREFWALKDVSFEVKKGQSVGIIGRNGSGKSTLLQMICGTLNPTSGSIQTRGRIAALLELGSGFNPEFTGRENIYLNGAVLGLSRDEVDARFDYIAAFADIGYFIEQPVKTYSSGMIMRLAFAVAINVDPQILVVDEALSVGDELFQRKCFSRIEEIRKKGATILFVSHSGSQIIELCDCAILIDAGEMLASGAPKQIVGNYQKLLYAPVQAVSQIRDRIRRSNDFVSTADVADIAHSYKSVRKAVPDVKNGGYDDYFDINLKPISTISYEQIGARIELPLIKTLDGNLVNNLVGNRFYEYTYDVKFSESAHNVHFAMLIKTTSGLELGGAVSASNLEHSIAYVESGSVLYVRFKFKCSLNPGVYFLNCGVVGDVNGVQTYLHRIIDAAMFRVLPISNNLATAVVDFGCLAEFDLIGTTEQCEVTFSERN